VEIEVRCDDRGLIVEVRDDGRGGADVAGGTGLSDAITAGLADRVAALKGRLDIHSPAGEGTIIRAAIPRAS
jgi:signal transduction histidine kinase